MRDPLEFKALPDEAFGDSVYFTVLGESHTFDELNQFAVDPQCAVRLFSCFEFFRHGSIIRIALIKVKCLNEIIIFQNY